MPRAVVDAPVAAVSLVRPGVAQPQPLVGRWLDLGTLSYGSRYRNTANWHGRRLFEFGQDRYVAIGKVKLDKDGRYGFGFRMSSGRYFNWAYADQIGGQYKDSVVAARAYKTPAESAALTLALSLDPNGAVYKAGIPSRGGYFYPREFYFSATPIDAVTVELGGLGFERGENTEITSFDDDGFISGERVRVQDPKHLFFDEIVATRAHLGSPLTPDFFGRTSDMGKSGYDQYLVHKKVNGHVAASVDFTGRQPDAYMARSSGFEAGGE